MPKARHFALINNMDGFFITGHEPDQFFNWSSLEGADVLVHHGGQPMTMFKYACMKAGIDITKINVIDAGNAKEMDAAWVIPSDTYSMPLSEAHRVIKHDSISMNMAVIKL